MIIIRQTISLMMRTTAGIILWLAMLPVSHAQTCAAPLQLSASTSFTASTCNGTIDMPFISSGTLLNHGPDLVYELAPPQTGPGTIAGTITLQPESGLDLALFLCTGKCSTYATCLQWIDSGPGNLNTLTFFGGLQLFAVVAHPSEVGPMCGNYSLQITPN